MGLTFETIRCLVTVFASVLFYDHIVQLPLEIRHMWKARFTPVTALYLCTR